MTEIEAAAKDYVMSSKISLSEPADITNVINLIEKAYIAGSKGKWHNIKENPTDLPSPYSKSYSKAVIIDKKQIAYYDHSDGLWYDWEDDYALGNEVIAWCDIPMYEE